MKTEIEGTVCDFCSHQLVLNYSQRGPKSGICDECGAMYAYDISDDNIRSVELAIDFDIERKVISEYSEETGNRAFIIAHVECDKEDVNAFLRWEREEYPGVGWSELW